MKHIGNIEEIDFDGAKILSVEKIERTLCLVVRLANSEEPCPLLIKFIDVKEEKAELYDNDDIHKANINTPPLDVIEVFKMDKDIFHFGGYLNSEPWVVWEFKAESYEILP
ncbi:MAG: hypothetical protein OEX07_14705 [Gammaproteobacteria bacterium]|nr:hypothetical protein [Gammaproteobacteria bacterium]